MLKRCCRPLLLALCLGATAGPLMAQDKITLKLATFLPPTHYGVTEGSDVFIKDVEELTDGAVDIEFYPAEQAGKARQLIELVKFGAVDIAEIGTGYVSSGELPLLGVLEVPGLVDSVCAGTRASRAIGDPGGPLYENDLKPAGLRVISYYVYSPYGPAASRRKIESVDDLQGLKMRNAGGLMELTVGKVGGVPMKLTSPEVTQSLQRGTLDAVMMSFAAVESYGYDEYAHYGATGYSMGTPGVFAMMSESRYQSLPEDVRAALDEAGKRAEENFCAFSEKDEARAIKDLQSSGRMEIYTWSDEDVATLDTTLASISEDWTAQLDARGKPATETLNMFKQALEAPADTADTQQ
ncbi:UNVERIFIED_ORG: TRAP-type C4-dicarboxylate transport system substrate-binding protein [Martelella mediterranea]